MTNSVRYDKCTYQCNCYPESNELENLSAEVADQYKSVNFYQLNRLDNNLKSSNQLKEDQNLFELIAEDEKKVAELGTTHEQLVQELEEIFKKVDQELDSKEVGFFTKDEEVIIGKLKISRTIIKGPTIRDCFLESEIAPLADYKSPFSIKIYVVKPRYSFNQTEEISVRGGMLSLIVRNHFYGGSSEYRVSPEQCQRIINLSKK